MRDEHLNGQISDTLLEARVLTEDWRMDFNLRTGRTRRTGHQQEGQRSRTGSDLAFL